MMKFVSCTALIALLSMPALAMGNDDGHGMRMPQFSAAPVKRADLEAQIKANFALLDTNKDGFVTTAESDAARAKLMTERRDQRFATLDGNKDGAISRGEFEAAAQARGTMTPSPVGAAPKMPMRGVGMARSDADGDGKISLKEVLTQRLARFDAADTNKDGTLTVEERTAARGQFGGRGGGHGWRR